MTRRSPLVVIALAAGLGAWGVGLAADSVLQASSPEPHAARLKPQASQGLGQFGVGPAPCKSDATATPSAPQGADYKANSPQKASFGEPGSGTKFVLTGTVSGLTCGPIKHATVDFWQADPQGNFDRGGFRFRGHQFTDTNGRFRLETVVPGAAGSAAPRIFVRVEVEKQPPFTTQLFFPDDSRNKTDAAFRPELVMKVTTGAGGKAGVFDIVLNI